MNSPAITNHALRNECNTSNNASGLSTAEPSESRKPKAGRWAWVILITLCTIGAAAVIVRIVALGSPPLSGTSPRADLNAHFSAKSGLILLHIVPSLLFVILAPLQFLSSLRQRYPRLHRGICHAVMGLGAVIGVSALVLSTHPVGGAIEASATTLFACFFLFSIAKAWWHMRNRQFALYREWSLRMTAIALGVATTRPIIGIFFATSALTGLTPQQFFGPAMWLGFTATWLAGEAWIRRTRTWNHGSAWEINS